MKLPLLSWREIIKVLTKAGFRVVRQKGSHVILAKNDYVVPVPKHREIKRGLLTEIISESGLTREEFLKLLREKTKVTSKYLNPTPAPKIKSFLSNAS